MCDDGGEGLFTATDNLILGIKTGRIYGITVTDVSSYIARSIFYEEIFDNLYSDEWRGLTISGIIVENHEIDKGVLHNSMSLTEQMRDNGYSITCIQKGFGMKSSDHDLPDCVVTPKSAEFKTNVWMKQQFIAHVGHSGADRWGGMLLSKDIPKLDVTYAASAGCMTSHFWWEDKLSNLGLGTRFAPTFIRKGGIGYHGNVGPGSADVLAFPYIAMGEFQLNSNMTLGEMDKKVRKMMNMSDYDKIGIALGVDSMTLLGDPTLSPNFKKIDYWTPGQYTG